MRRKEHYPAIFQQFFSNFSAIFQQFFSPQLGLTGFGGLLSIVHGGVQLRHFPRYSRQS